MSQPLSVAAIVVAAGRGLRAGPGLPKQYRSVSGQPAIRAALGALSAHQSITAIQAVIHPDDLALYEDSARGLDLLPAVPGGTSRQASVRLGLEALAPRRPELVLVHDAARPFASHGLVARAIEAGFATGAAIPVLPVADTVKRVDGQGCVTETVDRSQLRLVQTPQAFTFMPLLEAHRQAVAAGREDFTDDAALAEWAGLKVTTFAGEIGNVKVTTHDDLLRAEAAKLSTLSDVRTGFGFDVHQFGPGDHVMLGGLRIPHSHGLAGHSDADVVLHALVDAILGTLADGDIGVHFPPSEARWRGASSDQFLAFAVDRLRARGGVIAHVDLTVVCEAPRVGPHRDSIRARIAAIAGLPIDRVGLKATTSEKMGFTGRGEGMAAFATTTVRLPWNG
ncbi:MAG: bifunctional 2-C-methyl-D-erythritol 4-phosphate cytidylyltransferase/2-C-methyl-D-erythritol 2,4-cyclodiphosphate synthase [Xanthobacteraceae bacterium]